MAIICDIDDTLLRNGTQPIQHTIDWLNAQSGTKIIVTGRPNSQRHATERALHAAGVKYSRLIMNPGSSAETAQYKEEVGRKLKGTVTLAIDNNATMRAAYAKSGIKTMNPKDLPDVKKFWVI